MDVIMICYYDCLCDISWAVAAIIIYTLHEITTLLFITWIYVNNYFLKNKRMTGLLVEKLERF